MAKKFPKDRFDTVPDGLRRVGAHRAPPSKSRRWAAVGWALLAAAILVTVGVVGLFVVDGTLDVGKIIPRGAATTSATVTPPKPTPSVAPTVDPTLKVTVLNGTADDAVGPAVVSALTAAGWKPGPAVGADTSSVTRTVVYYGSEQLQAAALGAADALRASAADVSVKQSDHFVETGADLTVVVGSDFSLQ